MAGDTPDSKRIERIGIVLVHGVGEQRRFEHLDWQGREIIRAIARLSAGDYTVEISSAATGAFHADQDTWSAGPAGPVRMLLRRGDAVTHELHFHEVWWADVNERYSLAKQLRFWAWGLAVWAYPRGTGGRLRGTGHVTSPHAEGRNTSRAELWVRIRLFMVGVVFAVGALPFGLGLLLLQRAFNLQTPDLLKTVTNYVSGVKLFNQRSRLGRGFTLFPANDDFLDTLDEPPRVSVRRRMIRCIATVAQANYDSWYLIAHSQGTVAAFNGLMETAYAWPGYFDEASWRGFCAAGFGGDRLTPDDSSDAETMPRRPIWARPTEVAFRARIFEKLRGILTLGSPLEKFATIWPARVPISRVAAFRPGTSWVNVFDPVDPISGVLRSYNRQSPKVCPHPVNIGYAASPLLLLAHLRYLTRNGQGSLATAVAKWILTGNEREIANTRESYRPGSARFYRRRAWAWGSWLVLFLVLCVAGALTLRWLYAWITEVPMILARFHAEISLSSLAEIIGIGCIVTLFAGLLSVGVLFRYREDSPDPPFVTEELSDPGPMSAHSTPWES